MLEKILESDITSGVATVDLDNVFTDTYDVYLIKGYNIGSSSDGVTVQMRVRQEDGTLEDTNSAYNTSRLHMNDFTNSMSRLETVDQTKFFITRTEIGTGESEFCNFEIYVFNTRISSKTNIIINEVALDSNADFKFGRGQGYHERTEIIRGVQFFSSSGNLDNGKLVVYGFRKS